MTTHTDKVSIPGGWSGFGYIITDPVLGDGVYKISGGMNGALLILFLAAFLMVMGLFIFLAPGVALGLGLFGVAMWSIGSLGFIAGLAVLGVDINISILLATIGAVFSIGVLAVGSVTVAGIIGAIIGIGSLIYTIYDFLTLLNTIITPFKLRNKHEIV